tara:strand:+ start:197 stop:376 length:180 start_codon:yes stop_codon:yes gene_type:complete
MKRLLLLQLITLALPIGPILSHGYGGNCSEECNDYYCPPEHQLEKKEKEKGKNNILSKK